MTQTNQNDNPVQFILDNRLQEKARESWELVSSNTIEHPAALTCWAHAHVFSGRFSVAPLWGVLGL